MARTAFTVHKSDRDGETVVADNADSVNGNSFPFTGRDYLLIENTDVAARTASVLIARTVDGQTVPAKTIPIPASGKKLAGPFPDIYQQDADGLVYVDWDAATGLKITCMSLP